MTRFMLASLGATIAIGLGIFMFQGADDAPLATLAGKLGLGSGEPVIVIIVANPRAVASVRAAVPDDRVVADSPNGFALREGRIIAAEHDSASDLVSAAGWLERKLMLMQVRKKSRSSKTKKGDGDDGGLDPDLLAELLNKETLSYVEATLLLDHI